MLSMMSDTEVTIVILIPVVFFMLVLVGVWLGLRRRKP
jgi:hypothetical protein